MHRSTRSTQDQVKRLLTIQECLRRRPLRCSQLARRCGVTERTIYRDLGLLRRLGAAIAYDPGVQGYRCDGGLFTLDATIRHVLERAADRLQSIDPDLAGELRRLTTDTLSQRNCSTETENHALSGGNRM